MRSKRALLNSIFAVLSYTCIFVLNVWVRKKFLQVFGLDYLGINGLFSNILNILSISELGIGSAIIYDLYKPFAENDWKLISRYLKLYKECYKMIALIILLIGLVVCLFIPAIVGKTEIQENVRLLFLMNLADVVTSYLLSYRRSLFIADQKTYYIQVVHLCVYSLLAIVRYWSLSVFGSYVIYMILTIFFDLSENITINFWTKKHYKRINLQVESIDEISKSKIVKQVKGVLFHRIGGVLVQATDSIIISIFINVTMVGMYSNYSTIIGAFVTILANIYSSITSIAGNALLDKSVDVKKIYTELMFLSNIILTVLSSCILCSINCFITNWVGIEYNLPWRTVFCIVIAFYLQGLRRVPEMFIAANGIFYENKFVPMIECGCNLIFSIILVNALGLEGVFWGTVIGSIAVILFNFPKFCGEEILKDTKSEYLKCYFKEMLMGIVIMTIISRIIDHFILDKGWKNFIVRGGVAFFVSSLSFVIMNYKKEGFKSFANRMRGFIYDK